MIFMQTKQKYIYQNICSVKVANVFTEKKELTMSSYDVKCRRFKNTFI